MSLALILIRANNLTNKEIQAIVLCHEMSFIVKSEIRL